MHRSPSDTNAGRAATMPWFAGRAANGLHGMMSDSPARPVLEHLVVDPMGGLCNRLRAIASARRLCAKAGARCTVIWDWGDYRTLFDDDTDWMPYAAPMDRARGRLIPGYHHIRHLSPGEGGNRSNR